MYEAVVNNLKAFYHHRQYDDRILKEIDKEAQKSGETSPYRLKAIQYRVIAEQFQPVLIKGIPFYYELGTKISEGDGSPNFHGGKHPGGWLYYRNQHLFRDADPASFDEFMIHKENMFYSVCGPGVDMVHYAFPYENVIKNGLKSIYERALAQKENCKTEKEKDFLFCAMEGLLSVKRIAERFSEAAAEMLKNDQTLAEEETSYLERIADSASRIPWEAPKTFFEALNTLAFLREVSGSIDGIGQNALSRPDKVLKPFYDHDIKNGILTKEEAYDLICRFNLIWDNRYDKDSLYEGGAQHELENSLCLGGCDEHGDEVFNEITEMFIDSHNTLYCVYPKIMCRYSRKSSEEYLRVINRYLADGRSNIMLVNDDAVIPALLKSGKELTDARNYISSGCWDVTVEGCEKKPCGEYFNLMRMLELAIHKNDRNTALLDAAGLTVSPLETARDFEELYEMILRDIKQLIDKKCLHTNNSYRLWSEIHPSPFYSICMEECCESRTDFSAGGSKYAPSSMYMTFFANLVNALLSMKTVCFEKKECSLPELFTAMRKNWEGYEVLRKSILHAPFFGDESAESAAMAKRLHDDLFQYLEPKRNCFGGKYDMGYVNFVNFSLWGKRMKATPDGRRDGDFFAHGIEPTRYRPAESLPALVNSVSTLDFADCAANSVLNVILPAGTSLENMDAAERTMALMKLQSIQLNCVSREDLLDAQIHPEKHGDLVVRVCGFSAKFVSMSKEWQDEFIGRCFFEAAD